LSLATRALSLSLLATLRLTLLATLCLSLLSARSLTLLSARSLTGCLNLRSRHFAFLLQVTVAPQT
jgi:hypothetical protein